jgi:hypothetical protein
VALCGLGCTLPLYSIDGLVPWFGLGCSGLSIKPEMFSILIYVSRRLFMLLPSWVLMFCCLAVALLIRQLSVSSLSQSHLPFSLCVLVLFLLPFSFPL